MTTIDALQHQINVLQRRLDAMKKQSHTMQKPRVIDWSQLDLTVPLPCNVWDGNKAFMHTLFLVNIETPDRANRFIAGGRVWRECYLLPSPWLAHVSGRQPVPDGVDVEAVFRNGEKQVETAEAFSWLHAGCITDIIHYRITGELADGWVWNE